MTALVESLSNECFADEWESVVKRVFNIREGEDRMELWGYPGSCPFLDTAWQRVALPYELWRGGVILYPETAVYSACPDPMAYLDGLGEGEDFEGTPSLFKTFRDLGIDEVLLTNYPAYENPDHWLYGPPDYWFSERPLDESGKPVDFGSAIKLEPVVACSRDGTWGMVSYIEYHSVLGGTEVFMEAFLANAGGLDAVKHRFWQVDIVCSGFDTEFRGPRQTVDRFYDMLGWEHPKFPKAIQRLRRERYGKS